MLTVQPIIPTGVTRFVTISNKLELIVECSDGYFRLAFHTGNRTNIADTMKIYCYSCKKLHEVEYGNHGIISKINDSRHHAHGGVVE